MGDDCFPTEIVGTRQVLQNAQGHLQQTAVEGQDKVFSQCPTVTGMTRVVHGAQR